MHARSFVEPHRTSLHGHIVRQCCAYAHAFIKIQASFQDLQRPRISQIRNRILIGDLAPTTVVQQYPTLTNQAQNDIVLESFFEQKCLDIVYQQKDGTVSTRVIEIHFLYMYWPVWYLICFDHLRQQGRTFRIDRIQSANLTSDKFKLRDVSFFSPEIAQFTSPL